ncbi:hypothetical protein [Desulforhopalus singaporensis]|uniref:Uncharacterized protein n=1 Tax=Desulforhopalus singaporensis TaxID=91360 RepID=A0A1H0V989_9BACT|nr:hypothetical protein [Desulforhopalus singaporensis]SDP75102.1 hypothetical protein SAMN05660330_03941 [Desulforhopalus singaporensis]
MNDELELSRAFVVELEDIYEKLQQEYEQVAEELDFSCSGCPDNCCDSYFLHHTYAEWAYLWIGVKQLDTAARGRLIERAKKYLSRCEKALAAGERPQVMCPLNEGGLCTLYRYRLLVCRTHGVPAVLKRPDGKRLNFPGCFRCQEIVEARADKGSGAVNRTPMLVRLARLENELLGNKRDSYPRVKMTIAQMLVQGPPTLGRPHCDKRS